MHIFTCVFSLEGMCGAEIAAKIKVLRVTQMLNYIQLKLEQNRGCASYGST